MVGKLEKARGNTPPMLDLDTQESEIVIPDIDGSIAEAWPSTSWKSFIGWTFAVITAIVVGVIPALWINRWRGEADAAPAVEAHQQPGEQPPAGASAAPAAQPEVEQIEIDAPAPARPVAAAEPKTKTLTVKKPKRRPAKVKPLVRVQKEVPPPCDIYLHPHGCPR